MRKVLRGVGGEKEVRSRSYRNSNRIRRARTTRAFLSNHGPITADEFRRHRSACYRYSYKVYLSSSMLIRPLLSPLQSAYSHEAPLGLHSLGQKLPIAP